MLNFEVLFGILYIYKGGGYEKEAMSKNRRKLLKLLLEDVLKDDKIKRAFNEHSAALENLSEKGKEDNDALNRAITKSRELDKSVYMHFMGLYFDFIRMM
jgi:uncharacterized membrane protein